MVHGPQEWSCANNLEPPCPLPLILFNSSQLRRGIITTHRISRARDPIDRAGGGIADPLGPFLLLLDSFSVRLRACVRACVHSSSSPVHSLSACPRRIEGEEPETGPSSHHRRCCRANRSCLPAEYTLCDLPAPGIVCELYGLQYILRNTPQTRGFNVSVTSCIYSTSRPVVQLA